MGRQAAHAQMFDSHHLFHDPLHRHNNWEIHPAFRLEFCPKGKICTKNSNANWVDLKPFVKPKPSQNQTSDFGQLRA
jgi:hypothetical protein